MKPFLIALAVAAVATPALAENWRTLDVASTSTNEVALDEDSIAVVDRSKRRVRTRWYFKPNPEGRRMLISEEIYDCQTPVRSTRSMVTTFDDGRNDRQAWDDDQWDKIPPESIGEDIRQIVCAKR